MDLIQCYGDKDMADPLVAGVLIELATQRFASSSAEALAKKFTADAIAKIPELWQQIKNKLQGKSAEVDEALVKLESGDLSGIDTVTKNLDVVLDDPEFASELNLLAQTIQSGKIQDESTITQNSFVNVDNISGSAGMVPAFGQSPLNVLLQAAAVGCLACFPMIGLIPIIGLIMAEDEDEDEDTDNRQKNPEGKAKIVQPPHPYRESNATLYPLWFGTNRKLLASQDVSKGFSGERDHQIHYGTCHVAVPKSHKIGSVGTPWWKFVLTDDRLKLDRKSLNLLNETSFFDSIKHSLKAHPPDEHSALVFIHGFNVSFEAAALQAAQIGVDLQLRGIMAFYSWPSKGKLTGYSADEATIEASEQYIAEFLINLAQKSRVKKVHIIAHSMGNRGLLRAMQRIFAQVQATSEISFGQIFLAAPDVDPDLFRGLAAAYRQLSERTTLYVSAKDKALAASGIIHDHTRLGFFPPITVMDGIDTVEVSNIDLTLLGHGYISEARALLQDIHELLTHNTSPNDRFGLQSAQLETQKYWMIGK